MALTIDTSHSEIAFVVRHMVVAKVRGYFTKWSGTAEMTGDDFSTAKLDITIDAGSIDTREEKRDGHLKSADFFDVEKHPNLRFVSKKIEKKGGADYAIVGDLTMRGVTKEVTLAAEVAPAGKDPWGNQRIGLSATAKIDRTQWGLVWNQAIELGNVLVSNEVVLEINGQMIKA